MRFVALFAAFLLLDPQQPQQPQLAVTMQRVADEVVIEVGPVDIPARGEGSVPSFPAARVAIPTDGWFRGYRVEVVDRDGVALPDDVVKVDVLSLAERELFSPIALRVAAIAPGVPSAQLPRIVGYRAVRGDTLIVAAQYHGGDGRRWEGVRARIRFPFVSKSAFIGAFRIQPFSLDVTPPGESHVYDLPVGRSEQYWEGRPAVAVRILGFGGFIKKYAVLLKLEDRTTSKVIWEHHADTTAKGGVKPIPVTRYLWSMGRGLEPGHTYRLTAVYNNRSGAVVRDGGAGAIGGVVRVRGDGSWPRVDPYDSIYVRDLRAMMK